MKTDLTRSLIETSVRRALNQGGEAPERESRNLVDLGLHFSSGGLQKRILSAIQTMLQDPGSAYYGLVKDVLANTDHDRLMTFGVNLGYEGCSKGAKVIRRLEAEGGFNIPWAMALQLSGAYLEKQPDIYESILNQGADLGIRTYLLFTRDDLRTFLPVLKVQEKSAFVLSVWVRQVTQEFVDSLDSVPNVMVSVRCEPGFDSACAMLRRAQIPYGVLLEYTDDDRERILSGEWIESLLPSHPVFAFLLPSASCSEATQREVYEYVLSARQEQRYPAILMEIRQDIMMIDHYISGDTCFAAFDAEGRLHTDKGVLDGEEYNIFHNELKSILRLALRKD